MEQRTYIVIDLKSFYASVECVERGLDSMTARLVVADPERTEKTICLSISPAMKALGIHNRCRVFEIPKSVDYIMAQPRMQLYIDYAAGIYGIYLKYISKEDIHVYSIDECFMDVTNYLPLYQMTARELGQTIMADILREYGIRPPAGLAPTYLAKVALDITAKHSPDFIGELDEKSFKELSRPQAADRFLGIGRGLPLKPEVLRDSYGGETLPDRQDFCITARVMCGAADRPCMGEGGQPPLRLSGSMSKAGTNSPHTGGSGPGIMITGFDDAKLIVERKR
ncbi:MAG: hypothetical protein ACLSAC_17360 [Enterocloster bolteae]